VDGETLIVIVVVLVLVVGPKVFAVSGSWLTATTHGKALETEDEDDGEDDWACATHRAVSPLQWAYLRRSPYIPERHDG